MEKKLQDLLKHPHPKDLVIRVKKVSGYAGPVYMVEVPGGYAFSFHQLTQMKSEHIGGNQPIVEEISIAVLRRVKKHERLESNP